MYIIVLLIMFGTVFLALGSELMNLVDGFSLLLIILLPLALIYLSGLQQDLKRAFKILYVKENIYQEIEIEKSLVAIRALQSYLIGTGFFGTLLGVTGVFSMPDTFSNVLEPISVAMLTSLYGMMLYLLILPARYRIKALLVDTKGEKLES